MNKEAEDSVSDSDDDDEEVKEFNYYDFDFGDFGKSRHEFSYESNDESSYDSSDDSTDDSRDEEFTFSHIYKQNFVNSEPSSSSNSMMVLYDPEFAKSQVQNVLKIREKKKPKEIGWY